MNILYLCDEYPPGKHGGIGTVVQLLARELVKQGHRVIVAGFYDWGYGEQDHFFDEGVEVYRFRRKLASVQFPKSNSILGRIALKLLKLSRILEWDIRHSLPVYKAFLENIIQKNKIEVIEMPDFNDYLLNIHSYVPFPKLSVPVVVKLHGTLTYFTREAGHKEPEHIWKIEHDILQQASAVCSVSKYTALKTAEYLRYSKTIEVLYNGINADINIHNVQLPAHTVIYTGSLAEKKGIYQLMKAWNIVNNKMPEARLMVFGKGPVEKLRALLSEASVNTVSFKGHVSRQELFNNMANSALAVFPSYAECFALGPMEAMACGTAVIYSKRTSGPELINDGKDGVLIEPDDVEGIAENILALLVDVDRRQYLARNGKERVRQNFDIVKICREHTAYYQQVLKDSV